MSTAQPTFDDVWRMFQETDRKFQETDRLIKELFNSQKETDRKFQETNGLLNKQAQEMKELEKLFVGQWGKLMEALVEGDLVGILNQYGIAVLDTSTRLKGRSTAGENYEFDIVAHNGEEVIVVEVKTTLRPKHVKDFINKLDKFKNWLPRYAENRIYGAVAYLTVDSDAESMAEKRGLIVIRATGNSASIINAKDFKPRSW